MTSYLVHITERVIGDPVAMQARMISALPGDEHGERLDVLDGELHDKRRRAEGVRVEVEEDETAKLRWLLAAQRATSAPAPTSVASTTAATVDLVDATTADASVTAGAADQLLMVAKPLPQLLGLAAAVQRVF